ncbi:MAG: hypothetical protein NC336_02450 [Clostridium sp.]|nr:hypothetical protein [Clostridium sp.]
MATTALTRLAEKALPALSGASVTYKPEKNVYLTLGYTSPAGNTYFKAVRFSDRLAVHYDIGQGYAYTFLNGITLFAWDGTKAVIIGKKMWGGCGNWVCFNDRLAMEQTIQMLKNYLDGEAKAIGQSVSEQQLLSFSRQMVNDVQNYQRRIA